MAQIHVTLTGDNDYRVLTYQLDNSSAANKFLSVWKNIFSDYNNTVQEFDFECPTPVQSVEQLQQRVFDICNDIVTHSPDISIPQCWKNVPYTQDDLNELHDKFAENTQMSPGTDIQRKLSDLNFSIHELEAKIMNENSELFDNPPYISSCSAYNIEQQYSQPLTADDSLSYDAGFKYQNCLIIGYNTLGKDLQALVFDNDTNSMKRNDRYVPKTDIKSQFSIIVVEKTLTDTELDSYRTDMKKHIAQWCADNNSINYGVDPDNFVNQPGRLIIGHCTTTDDYEWITKQTKIDMHRVTFDFGYIRKENENSYKITSTS